MSARTLQDLLDIEAIRTVEAEYCEAIDEFDLERVIATFTEDCVTDYGAARGGAEVGHEALRRRWQGQTGGATHTHHQLGQVRVTLRGDEADCIAYAIADHDKKDGTRITFRYQYRDMLRRTSAGWRIAHRRLLFTVVDGAAGERDWLPRKDPRA
jgi:ketosteroid isomerase-like protein